MSIFTFRVTQPAVNAAGTAFGQQPDLNAPSFFDLVVTNSTDPVVKNGVYDCYCLNPQVNVKISKVRSWRRWISNIYWIS